MSIIYKVGQYPYEMAILPWASSGSIEHSVKDLVKKIWEVRNAISACRLFLVMTSGTERVFAHKAKHTQKQLKAFEESFMEQVCLGALPCRP